jgi:predicted nucleic acid-binding protein
VSLVVVDASVFTAFYTSDDPRRDAVVSRLSVGDALFAPAHLDAEVVSALRSLAIKSAEVSQFVPSALAHLADFPIRRMPLAPLLGRMWELRDSVTPYDAAYVALAERLDSPVMTCDVPMTKASGTRCRFDLII